MLCHAYGGILFSLCLAGIVHDAALIPCHSSFCCAPLKRLFIFSNIFGYWMTAIKCPFKLTKTNSFSLSPSILCSNYTAVLLTMCWTHLYFVGISDALEARNWMQILDCWIVENKHFPWLGGSTHVKAAQYTALSSLQGSITDPCSTCPPECPCIFVQSCYLTN